MFGHGELNERLCECEDLFLIKMASQDKENLDPYLNLDPSEDIQLNVFLLDIAKDITEDDLQCLKFLLQGGSKKKVLSEIKTPLELFTHMRQRLLLTRDNLIVLQSFIWNLGNRQILNKFIEFADKIGDTLHFSVPRDTPENGYKYLHFHVKGNLDSFSRPMLEAIRCQTSKFLGVPEGFVIVAGLQPSDSLILTFMVPEECYPSTRKMTSKQKELLEVLGVDVVTIQGGDVIFDDVQETLRPSSEHQSQNDLEMHRLLMKVENLEKQLEVAHIDELRQTRNLSHCAEFKGEENVIINVKMLLKLLTTALYIIYDPPKSTQYPKLEESSLINFKRMLKKVKNMGYDEDIIHQLLDANTMIAKTDNNKISMINEFVMKSQAYVNQAHVIQILRLEYECDKLRYYMGIGEKDKTLSEREEFFLQSVFNPVMLQVEIKHLDSSDVHTILDKLSKDLGKEEWETLYSGAEITAEEENTLQTDRSKLLQVLYSKWRQDSPIDVFLGNILSKVKRRDLLRKFKELAEKRIQEKEKNRISSEHGRKGQRQTKQHAAKHMAESEGVRKLAEQMTRIESKLDLMSNPFGNLPFSKDYRNLLLKEYPFPF